MRLVASLVGVGVVFAAACSSGNRPAGPAQPAEDLLALFPDAEKRSDTLDLRFLLPLQDLRAQGWTEVDPGHGEPVLWSRKLSATLHLPLFLATPKELRLRALCHSSLGALPLAISLNGAPAGEVRLAPTVQEFRLPVLARLQIPGANVLEFRVPRRFEPAKGDSEERPKAVGLLGLELRPQGRAGPVAPPALEGSRLRLPGGSSVGYFLRLRPASTLEVDLGRPGPGARLRVLLDTESGCRHVTTVSGGSAKPVRIDLPPCSGPARLELANSGDGELLLQAAWLRVPAAARPRTAPLPRRRPNLIIYLSDALRADYLGAYGHPQPTSPRLDAFARQGLLFDRCAAESSWTQPAVASILTGLSAGSHGVHGLGSVLVPGIETLTELLKRAGYRTAAFVSNNVVSQRRGLDQGFDAWNDGDNRALYGARAATLVGSALRWAASSGEPFLMYIHTMETHWPYQPSEEDWAPFRIALRGPAPDPDALLAKRPLAEDDFRFLRSRYQGAVLENDRAFGELLDGLVRLGLLDRSLVVFTSDHGEEFGEHGGLLHRFTLYQEVLHVPLVVRLPGGQPAGVRVSDPVHQIDILPSLAGLLRLPVPSEVEGRDLSARWLGSTEAADEPEMISELQYRDLRSRAVSLGPTKLILNQGPRIFWRAGAAVELYDLAADAAELNNLASSRPIALGYLRQRAAAMRRFQDEQRRRTGAGLQVAPLSADERSRLRALGYLE